MRGQYGSSRRTRSGLSLRSSTASSRLSMVSPPGDDGGSHPVTAAVKGRALRWAVALVYRRGETVLHVARWDSAPDTVHRPARAVPIVAGLRVGVQATTQTHSEVSGAADIDGLRMAWAMESAASVRLSPR